MDKLKFNQGRFALESESHMKNLSFGKKLFGMLALLFLLGVVITLATGELLGEKVVHGMILGEFLMCIVVAIYMIISSALEPACCSEEVARSVDVPYGCSGDLTRRAKICTKCGKAWWADTKEEFDPGQFHIPA
ncbi:MAG: hypothetical protein WC385_03570 [Candidatus Paceibacterota bacterium]